MSLEAKIEALTATIERLAVASERLIELRTDAIETVRSTAAPAAKTTTNAAAAKAETSAPVAETAAAETKAPAVVDEAAYDEIKKLVADYNKGSDRPEEVQARKEKVRWLLRQPSLCKPEKISDTTTFSLMDIMPEKIPAMVKNITKLIANGDLTQPAAADATDDELV